MQDTAKYLVHADITADGIVERSDVVGAVFGQTEGLLGDELDLRELQDASKVGRIDVEIDSQNGQSFGRITIATSLDRVETAILGAALETIDRVGPCRSTIEVRKIEDVRAAKRREVVERAKTLLTEGFAESMRSSRDLVEEVRESARIEDITEYEGLPAGPHVEDSDAIVVVEGRADVLTLLQYGIKNAVAVEGTDVPDAIAELTRSRTVTAFFDGDRGGELIRRELAQVGDIDYVAFAPEGESVEDLDRHEVMDALREKTPYEQLEEAEGAADPDDDEAPDAEGEGASADGAEPRETSERQPTPAETATEPPAESAVDASDIDIETADEPASSNGRSGTEPESEDGDGDDEDDGASDTPGTLRGHTREVIGESSGRVRLLDATFGTLAEGDAGEAFELVADAETVPRAVVVDAELDQRLLDVAAQRGIDHVVAGSTGEFVKRPTSVRIRTAEQLLAPNEA
jgi:DNA primase